VKLISKGTNKGKGNLPLYFSCGIEGQFYSRCPYVKYEGNDDEYDFLVMNARAIHKKNKDNKEEKINVEEEIEGIISR